MGAFLSVAKGSEEPPWLLEVRYNGGDPGSSPLALVGKGQLDECMGAHISIKCLDANSGHT